MSDVEESLDERVSIRFSFQSKRLEGNLKEGKNVIYFVFGRLR